MQNQTVSGSVSKRGRAAALATVAAATLVGSEGSEAIESSAPAESETAASSETSPQAEAPKRSVEEQYLENQAAIDAARKVLAAAEAKQTDLANRCKANKLTQLTLGGRKCQVRKESEKKGEKSESPNHYFHFAAERTESAVVDASAACV